jgi:hypothetical protein
MSYLFRFKPFKLRNKTRGRIECITKGAVQLQLGGEKKRKLAKSEVQKKYVLKGGESTFCGVEPPKLRDLKTSGPHPT